MVQLEILAATLKLEFRTHVTVLVFICRKQMIWYQYCRDGPKFGRRRSSAECSARQHGTIRPNFGVICGFAFAALCTRRWR